MYKLQFNKVELKKLNTIKSKKVRLSTMSLYSYLYKHITKNDNMLCISLKKLMKKYNRSHEKLSLTALLDRVTRLLDLKLINVTKVNNTNCYFLNNVKQNNLNPTESGMNTKVNSTQEKHKYIYNNNNIYIDLYSYNNNYKFNIENYKKCNSLVDVRLKAKELLNRLRVRSPWIKDRVLVKVSQNFRNITIKFLENYIIKVISSARELYYKNYRKYIKSKTLPNFTERNYSKDFYNYIENNLIIN